MCPVPDRRRRGALSDCIVSRRAAPWPYYPAAMASVRRARTVSCEDSFVRVEFAGLHRRVVAVRARHVSAWPAKEGVGKGVLCGRSEATCPLCRRSFAQSSGRPGCKASPKHIRSKLDLSEVKEATWARARARAAKHILERGWFCSWELLRCRCGAVCSLLAACLPNRLGQSG